MHTADQYPIVASSQSREPPKRDETGDSQRCPPILSRFPLFLSFCLALQSAPYPRTRDPLVCHHTHQGHLSRYPTSIRYTGVYVCASAQPSYFLVLMLRNERMKCVSPHIPSGSLPARAGPRGSITGAPSMLPVPPPPPCRPQVASLIVA